MYIISLFGICILFPRKSMLELTQFLQLPLLPSMQPAAHRSRDGLRQWWPSVVGRRKSLCLTTRYSYLRFAPHSYEMFSFRHGMLRAFPSRARSLASPWMRAGPVRMLSVPPQQEKPKGAKTPIQRASIGVRILSTNDSHSTYQPLCFLLPQESVYTTISSTKRQS